MYLRISLVGFALAALLGCSSGQSTLPEGAPPVYDVSGTVTYNGSPLSDAIVVFAPKNGNVSGSAHTNSEGKFVAQAYPPTNGIPEGDYQVTVSKTESVEVTGGDPDNVQTKTNYLIPKKFGQPQTSGLTLTVTKDGKDDVLFELKD
ncbi:hypothetical protein GC197_16575 [bacterium]|nr:hypothetical protein [bacterium]